MSTLSNWLGGLALPPLTPALVRDLCALAAGLAGVALLGLERRGGGLIALAVVTALAGAMGAAGPASGAHAPLVVGLVIAALAREPRESLHAECAIKLLWVMGVALALSLAGQELLTIATGTTIVSEQWAVLKLGLDPRFLWSTALPLSLLLGLVLIGGPPFHFWVADLFQGVRPWLAPLAVAALQTAGATWLTDRLEGVSSFPPASQLITSLLGIAALVAFAGGAATLLIQRRPERRAGSLASLNGALLLAALATGRPLRPSSLAEWSAHLALALTGASTLARFLPVPASSAGGPPAIGAPLFRRHPLSGAIGLFSLFSLAGVPGTPGSVLWLRTARALIESNRIELLVALAAAWLAGLMVCARQVREAVGVPAPRTDLPVSPVPRPARAALWVAGLGLVALAILAKRMS
jgi:NADH:ubiquinone oxidoreductase subunit 2 (subunit N)